MSRQRHLRVPPIKGTCPTLRRKHAVAIVQLRRVHADPEQLGRPLADECKWSRTAELPDVPRSRRKAADVLAEKLLYDTDDNED